MPDLIQTPNESRHAATRRRIRSRLALAVLAGSVLLGAAAPDGGVASTPAAHQLSGLSARTVAGAAAKKKKKATKKKKTSKKCYAYRTVKGKNGKKRRVRVTTKCKAPPKLCVKKKNGKSVYKLQNVYKTVTRHGKKTRVQVFVKVKVKGKGKRAKFKRVPKKARVPVLVSCSSQGPSSGSSSPGIPVTVTLQPGSMATLDFYQFTKQTPLSGTVKGFIAGSYDPTQTNQLNLTGGKISVASVPVFIDDRCDGQVSSSIQTDPTTTAKVDPSKTSTTTISPSGTITGTLNLILTLAIDLRHGDSGCNQPYLTTGYTTLPISVRLFGKLNGLTATLHSPEQILDDLTVCIQPGQTGAPCSGFAVPLPIGFSNDIIGAVTIG